MEVKFWVVLVLLVGIGVFKNIVLLNVVFVVIIEENGNLIFIYVFFDIGYMDILIDCKLVEYFYM